MLLGNKALSYRLVFGFDCNQVDVIRSPLLQITVPKVSRIYVVFNSLLILLDAEDFHFIQTINKELFEFRQFINTPDSVL